MTKTVEELKIIATGLNQITTLYQLRSKHITLEEAINRHYPNTVVEPPPGSKKRTPRRYRGKKIESIS